MNEDVQLKRNAYKIAKSLLDSDNCYLDKVIELWKIGNGIYGECWNTEFHIFGVIESDTDHLPIEKVRQFCSVKMIENTDKEIKEVISFYKKDVAKACNEILSMYENV